MAAELVTWCRIMRVGPACAVPCDDCRRDSRRLNLAVAAGVMVSPELDPPPAVCPEPRDVLDVVPPQWREWVHSASAEPTAG